MKAWLIRGDDDDYGAEVVFAESRNKAKMIALYDDVCSDTPYIRIKCSRLKSADKYYRGNSRMDWNDDDDRVALVKDFNFSCVDYDNRKYCNPEHCSAYQYCMHGAEYDIDGLMT